jgi:hypothetical protein
LPGKTFAPRLLVLFSVLILLICFSNSESIQSKWETTNSSCQDTGKGNYPSRRQLKEANDEISGDLSLEGLELQPVNINTDLTVTINANQTDYWLIENLEGGQLVYFNINSSMVLLENQTSLYRTIDSLNASLVDNEEYFVHRETEEVFGYFSVDPGNDYILVINSTLDGNYTILITLLDDGYNYETAIEIRPDTPLLVNVNVKQQLFYWKVRLEPNQLGTVLLKENTTNILSNSNLTIYDRPDGTLLPPKEVGDDGSIEITWKRVEDKATNEFYAFLSRSISNPLGNFTIILTTQSEGYTFANAIEITVNETYIATVQYIGNFQEVTYFKVGIGHANVWVNFWLEELSTDSNILERATIQIYDPVTQYLTFESDEEFYVPDGTISDKFWARNPGDYYFKVRPNNIGAIPMSSYSIRFEYPVPPEYQWYLSEFIASLIILSLIPVVHFIDRRYLSTGGSRVTFSVNQPIKNVFKRFVDNPRFSKTKLVPDAHIMAEQAFYTGTFRIEFTEMAGETSIHTWRPLRKFEVFKAFILIWLLYFALNIIIFSQTVRTMLPWQFITIEDVIVVHLVALLIFLIGYSITTLYPDLVFKNFTQEVRITVSEVINQVKGKSGSPTVDKEFVKRNMSYIRVLWNQARKAFNTKDFGTFMIKADSCVKKLVELRHMQLERTKEGESDSRMENISFQVIISRLRENGFDIPSERKIEHYRRLRNKVVHGSLLLDESTAIDSFSFYAKFLGRLGLRT